MANPADLLPEPTTAEGPVRVKVRKGADGLGDVIKVATPEGGSFKVRFWMPCGDVLPSAGDIGLIVFDDRQEPWLVAFSPS
jgi:hypothetical protein